MEPGQPKKRKQRKPDSNSAQKKAERRFGRIVGITRELSREELKRRIKGFRGTFKMDFTDDYLEGLSDDRLRHLLLAAMINRRGTPGKGAKQQ